MIVALLCTAVALLASCAESPAGSEAAFDRGRADGCNSGLSDANKPGYDTRYTRNQALYAADTGYREGWDKGYDTCYWREYRYPTWESGLGGM
ncbi:MAG: hypothetical protein O3A96_02950 [Proteobacteria bacterium]|nr:hypothetical protein [Pseudomonadota bacterium]